MVESGFEMGRENFLSSGWFVRCGGEVSTKMLYLNGVMERDGLCEEGRIYPILTNVS